MLKKKKKEKDIEKEVEVVESEPKIDPTLPAKKQREFN